MNLSEIISQFSLFIRYNEGVKMAAILWILWGWLHIHNAYLLLVIPNISFQENKFIGSYRTQWSVWKQGRLVNSTYNV
jgi:hypothetical protein